MHGRDALRTQLWPEIITNLPLCWAVLLTATTHSGQLRGFQSSAGWLRQMTIQDINNSVASGSKDGVVGDAVIAALSLLGGWELEYGDAESYEFHMQALRDAVEGRGGLPNSSFQCAHDDRPRLSNESIRLAAEMSVKKPISQITADLVSCSVSGHGSFTGMPQHFRPPKQQVPQFPILPSVVPHGLARLRDLRLIQLDLLYLISKLACFDADGPYATERACELSLLIAGWHPYKDVSLKYCPPQSCGEDSISAHAHSHLRLVGLYLCHALFLVRTDLSVPTLVSRDERQAGCLALYDEAQAMQPDLIVGTFYEGMVLWSLFVIVAMASRLELKHRTVIRKMIQRRHIRTWEQMREHLLLFIYPASLLDTGCRWLWDELEISVEQSNSIRFNISQRVVQACKLD